MYASAGMRTRRAPPLRRPDRITRREPRRPSAKRKRRTVGPTLRRATAPASTTSSGPDSSSRRTATPVPGADVPAVGAFEGARAALPARSRTRT